ncbi:MAG TPA: 16S rRNA (guanine(527)-N(7))-methyltransferase RsmG [Candidatus Acidoferrales bacterium]|nr:16S rRNA (guanine(527)-N(7))-methyltransferase RsmG [Candidatus Acidoferrales bacterium]
MALLEAAGVEARLLAPLAQYAFAILESNRRFNLTGAKTAAELVPHLIDSLSVAPYVREPYVDVGSGAGLPAIPVAIATGARVTLIESTAKKARFLESAMRQLRVHGEVIAERAEVAAHEDRFRERFASATARAVSAAPTVAELVLPLLEAGGVAILQRGAMDARERTALEDAALMLGGEMERELALEGERRILLVRKTGSTPQRFPRRPGVPEKRPLCFQSR